MDNPNEPESMRVRLPPKGSRGRGRAKAKAAGPRTIPMESSPNILSPARATDENLRKGAARSRELIESRMRGPTATATARSRSGRDVEVLGNGGNSLNVIASSEPEDATGMTLTQCFKNAAKTLKKDSSAAVPPADNRNPEAPSIIEIWIDNPFENNDDDDDIDEAKWKEEDCSAYSKILGNENDCKILENENVEKPVIECIRVPKSDAIFQWRREFNEIRPEHLVIQANELSCILEEAAAEAIVEAADKPSHCGCGLPFAEGGNTDDDDDTSISMYESDDNQPESESEYDDSDDEIIEAGPLPIGGDFSLLPLDVALATEDENAGDSDDDGNGDIEVALTTNKNIVQARKDENEAGVGSKTEQQADVALDQKQDDIDFEKEDANLRNGAAISRVLLDSRTQGPTARSRRGRDVEVLGNGSNSLNAIASSEAEDATDMTLTQCFKKTTKTLKKDSNAAGAAAPPADNPKPEDPSIIEIWLDNPFDNDDDDESVLKQAMFFKENEEYSSVEPSALSSDPIYDNKKDEEADDEKDDCVASDSDLPLPEFDVGFLLEDSKDLDLGSDSGSNSGGSNNDTTACPMSPVFQRRASIAPRQSSCKEETPEKIVSAHQKSASYGGINPITTQNDYDDEDYPLSPIITSQRFATNDLHEKPKSKLYEIPEPVVSSIIAPIVPVHVDEDFGVKNPAAEDSDSSERSLSPIITSQRFLIELENAERRNLASKPHARPELDLTAISTPHKRENSTNNHREEEPHDNTEAQDLALSPIFNLKRTVVEGKTNSRFRASTPSKDPKEKNVDVGSRLQDDIPVIALSDSEDSEADFLPASPERKSVPVLQLTTKEADKDCFKEPSPRRPLQKFIKRLSDSSTGAGAGTSKSSGLSRFGRRQDNPGSSISVGSSKKFVFREVVPKRVVPSQQQNLLPSAALEAALASRRVPSASEATEEPDNAGDNGIIEYSGLEQPLDQVDQRSREELGGICHLPLGIEVERRSPIPSAQVDQTHIKMQQQSTSSGSGWVCVDRPKRKASASPTRGGWGMASNDFNKANNEKEEELEETVLEPRVTRRKKRKAKKANPFIEDEATVSGDDSTSGTEASSESEADAMESFVEDNDDDGVTESQQVRYLKSTKDMPANFGRVEKPLEPVVNVSVLNQTDADYETDSFCVGADDVDYVEVGDFTQAMVNAKVEVENEMKGNQRKRKARLESDSSESPASEPRRRAPRKINLRSRSKKQLFSSEKDAPNTRRRRIIEDDSSDDE